MLCRGPAFHGSYALRGACQLWSPPLSMTCLAVDFTGDRSPRTPSGGCRLGSCSYVGLSSSPPASGSQASGEHGGGGGGVRLGVLPPFLTSCAAQSDRTLGLAHARACMADAHTLAATPACGRPRRRERGPPLREAADRRPGWESAHLQASCSSCLHGMYAALIIFEDRSNLFQKRIGSGVGTGPPERAFGSSSPTSAALLFLP